jgi:hypothetical protein
VLATYALLDMTPLGRQELGDRRRSRAMGAAIDDRYAAADTGCPACADGLPDALLCDLRLAAQLRARRRPPRGAAAAGRRGVLIDPGPLLSHAVDDLPRG